MTVWGICCPSCHVTWNDLWFLLVTKSWILLFLLGFADNIHKWSAQFHLESSENKTVLFFPYKFIELYPWTPDSISPALVTPESQPPILAPLGHQELAFVFPATGNSANSCVHNPQKKKNWDNVDWPCCDSCIPGLPRKSRRSLRMLPNTGSSQKHKLGCTHLSQTPTPYYCSHIYSQIFPEGIWGAT